MMRSTVIFLILAITISVFAEQNDSTHVGSDTRIIAGWEAQEGQFPYIIYLRGVSIFGDITACGGSIIHTTWGLSSAKCIAQRTSITVRAGSVNSNTPRVMIDTTTYFTHPEYIDALQQITQPNDVGLIFFGTSLTFDSFVQPIRLAPSMDMNRDYTGAILTTGGWGSTYSCDPMDSYCPMSEKLNWVQLAGISNFMCLLMFNSNYLVRSSTICAAPYREPNQSICSGDSGVPLVVMDDDGIPSQVGVASFVGQWGCSVGFPGGFVRPHYYHDWIRAQTGIDFNWRKSATFDAPMTEEDAAKLRYI